MAKSISIKVVFFLINQNPFPNYSSFLKYSHISKEFINKKKNVSNAWIINKIEFWVTKNKSIKRIWHHISINGI